MFLVAIIDDLTWFSTCTKLHEHFVEYMCGKYDLKYFDTVDWLIGMQIKQDELFQVSLNQSDYVKSICQEYNHLVQIYYKTPADPKVRLCPDSYPTNIPIPMINGKFLYASNT